jgi:hypothetical protein
MVTTQNPKDSLTRQWGPFEGLLPKLIFWAAVVL